MEREEQLAWERKWGKWAAVAAVAAAVLTLAGSLFQLNLLNPRPVDNVAGLILVDQKMFSLTLAVTLQALGTACVAGALYYLFRATRFRREQVPRILVFLVIVMPVLAGIVSIVYQLQLNDIAERFVNGPSYSPQGAKDAVSDELKTGAIVVVSSVGTAAGLGLAFSYLLTSLNAMRAGLLSRFMGYMGVIVALLGVLPFFPLPVAQIFWLGALGALFLDRFPQGRGPAWASGEADPWPTAQDRRAELEGRTPGRRDEPEPEPEPAGRQHTGEPARPRQVATHSRSKKKKRKRR